MPITKEQIQDIESAKSNYSNTIRATSPRIEKILYDVFPVLDHGFVRVIDYMGNDAAIAQAARVSYGQGTKKISEDKNLIFYLMRHDHTTPFEMCEIKLHIKLPIFIARQWIRHRTANVNEYSGRYSIMTNEFYLPDPVNLAPQSKQNKQGRDDRSLSKEDSSHILDLLKSDAEQCYKHYREMINEDDNGEIINDDLPSLTRELARMNLTLNYYTEWYWKIDLHNLFHFLKLRVDEHAQYEIREYARIMLNIVKEWTPIAYESFIEYVKGGVSISDKGIKIIRSMLKGEDVKQEDSGMSKREWNELMNKFKI